MWVDVDAQQIVEKPAGVPTYPPDGQSLILTGEHRLVNLAAKGVDLMEYMQSTAKEAREILDRLTHQQ